jgi:iron complex outermembrane recepter protein
MHASTQLISHISIFRRTFMFTLAKKCTAWRIAFATIATGGSLSTSSPTLAQSATDELDEIVITGSRIRRAGLESSSPINTLSVNLIEQQQEVSIEKVIRVMPFSIPGDGENTNNGTNGAATINLRGLGEQRNLALVNGRRITPFISSTGSVLVDTSTIPLALVERVEVVTGGASAVYGSDAIAGAINIITKNNFQGVDFQVNTSQTAENDGQTHGASLTLGSGLADDKGNIAVNLSWSQRDAILLGQRFLGTLGIDTASGANYNNFLAGKGPSPSAIAGCDGPDSVASGGSTTSIPTRVELSAGGSVGQFLNNGSLYTGDAGTGLGARGGCSVFNFNPYNYYQTPGERYNAMLIGNYEVNEHANVYAQLSYTNASVTQQVAPSGTFGTAFNVPMYNPLWPAVAKAEVLAVANERLTSGVLIKGTNWQDVNANGVVDEADILRMRLRRRTTELGARSESYDTENFTFLSGVDGILVGDWHYDASFQYGETNRTTVRAGYTNLTNIQNALMTKDGKTCENGDSTCVPINLFGGFGTITPAMSGYAQAIALQQQKYNQTILQVVADGPVNGVQLPWASNPLALSVGYEHRDEEGETIPDECLKLAPASCQGGAGGNILPIKGGFVVEELFFEANLPLIEEHAFAQSLTVELGGRQSDYDTVGSVDTWKAGINWRLNDQLMFRFMEQEATRAPNVGELFANITRGLDSATKDPCSVANAANIDAKLRALCISTGMLPQHVGTVGDVISGQVQTFDGSDPVKRPGAEQADTTTVGLVWTPDFSLFNNFELTADYYDITVNDIIGEFSAQEILDGCYINGFADACGKIKRVNGDLQDDTAGVIRYTTNLAYQQAEGIEVGVNFGFDLANLGDLQFYASINKYLTQETLSSSTVPVINCKGYYGTTCDPLSDLRWVQGTTWNWRDLSVSLQWRHIDAIDKELPEAAATFAAFRSIDAYNYFDLSASYKLFDGRVTLTGGVQNLTDEDPPVLGNEVGDTSSNSGNTFPSNYDTLGRIYSLGFRTTL